MRVIESVGDGTEGRRHLAHRELPAHAVPQRRSRDMLHGDSPDSSGLDVIEDSDNVRMIQAGRSAGFLPGDVPQPRVEGPARQRRL